MQINHYKTCTPNPLFNRALTLQGHYPLALTTPGPNIRQLGYYNLMKIFNPMYYNLMKIFNPRTALLVPSHGIHNRGCCRHLPHSLCLLTDWYFSEWYPTWHAMPSVSRDLWLQRTSFFMTVVFISTYFILPV